MLHPQRGHFSRGTSVLAALVFVAVLSGLAYGVHKIAPTDAVAQTASVGGVLANVTPDTTQVAQAPAAPAAKAVLVRSDSNSRCIQPLSESDQKKLEILAGQADTLCVPACTYFIYPSSQVKSRDDCSAWKSVGYRSEKECVAEVAQERIQQQKRKAACIVQTCTVSSNGEPNCREVSGKSSVELGQLLMKEIGIGNGDDIRKAYGLKIPVDEPFSADKLVLLAETNPAEAREKLTLLSATERDTFTQTQAQTLAANQEKIQTNQDKIDTITGSGGTPADTKALVDENARLVKANDNLREVDPKLIAGQQLANSKPCVSDTSMDPCNQLGGNLATNATKPAPTGPRSTFTPQGPTPPNPQEQTRTPEPYVFSQAGAGLPGPSLNEWARNYEDQNKTQAGRNILGYDWDPNQKWPLSKGELDRMNILAARGSDENRTPGEIQEYDALQNRYNKFAQDNPLTTAETQRFAYLRGMETPGDKLQTELENFQARFSFSGSEDRRLGALAPEEQERLQELKEVDLPSPEEQAEQLRLEDRKTKFGIVESTEAPEKPPADGPRGVPTEAQVDQALAECQQTAGNKCYIDGTKICIDSATRAADNPCTQVLASPQTSPTNPQPTSNVNIPDENCVGSTCTGRFTSQTEREALEAKGYKCGYQTIGDSEEMCTKPNPTYSPIDKYDVKCQNGVCATRIDREDIAQMQKEGFECPDLGAGKDAVCTKCSYGYMWQSSSGRCVTPEAMAKTPGAVQVKSPTDLEKYKALKYDCATVANDISASEIVCTPPTRAPAPAPAPRVPTPAPAPAPAPPTNWQAYTGPRTNQSGGLFGVSNQQWMQGLTGALMGLSFSSGLNNQSRYGSGYGSGYPAGYQPPIGNSQPQPPGTCGQAQYCQNNIQYMRNTQCVDQPMQNCQFGCDGNTCATSPACPTPPKTPPISSCTNGAWREVSTTLPGGKTCVVDWKCVVGAEPKAEISCAPLVAESGTTIAISYTCTNSTTSTSKNFTASSTDATHGSASPIVPTPPPGNGTNSIAYGITCTNEQGQAATDACTVQIVKPSIVMLATPPAVVSGTTSTIGWITTSMQSCVVSSPDSTTFTTQNAGNTTTNGTAVTPALTAAMRVFLTCTTLSGNQKTASTTVTVQ